MRPLSTLLLPTLACCFTVQSPNALHGRRWQGTRLFLSETGAAAEDADGSSNNNELILDTTAMAQQMAGLRSKYPTAEADYLAAARARAAAKKESTNYGATDDDWKEVKEKTKAVGGQDDDWEVSAKEAGNIDSQILIPMMNDDEDDEPKLMLI